MLLSCVTVSFHMYVSRWISVYYLLNFVLTVLLKMGVAVRRGFENVKIVNKCCIFALCMLYA